MAACICAREDDANSSLSVWQSCCPDTTLFLFLDSHLFRFYAVIAQCIFKFNLILICVIQEASVNYIKDCEQQSHIFQAAFFILWQAKRDLKNMIR